METDRKDWTEFFVAGQSRVMERLRETIQKAAEADAGVLLSGEAGTGKKMIARCLHDQSWRRQKKFVAINCSTISVEVLENDLFGRQPKAFDEEKYPCVGILENAQGGTVYLDKIDCLPLRLQDRLLNVLQERDFKRLRSNEPLGFRIIASTKRDLKKSCEEGSFRDDLFYRMNVIPIALPPLREHREDIPPLFRHFAFHACALYQRPTRLMTSEIFQDLMKQDWPGNVRELKNAAERFALGFDPVQNNPEIPAERNAPNDCIDGGKRSLVEKMNAFEKILIVQELDRTKGNVKKTYQTLGLPRKTFYDKMNKHGLKRKDFLMSGN